MLQAAVIGHATSTIKHASLQGWRLAIVQTLGPDAKPEGDVILAVDNLGCSPGDRVVINSDGRGARALIGNDKSPVRWYVCGIVDQ